MNGLKSKHHRLPCKHGSEGTARDWCGPIRTLDEVVAEYNRRNPDDQLNRIKAWWAEQQGMRKIAIAVGAGTSGGQWATDFLS